MPSSSFIGTVSLATGQSAPFTGEWVNIAIARNAMFVLFGNKANSIPVGLQTKTALSGLSAFSTGGEHEAVDLYGFPDVGSGYAPAAFMDSPISHVRLYTTGSGNNIWAYASLQN